MEKKRSIRGFLMHSNNIDTKEKEREREQTKKKTGADRILVCPFVHMKENLSWLIFFKYPCYEIVRLALELLEEKKKKRP